MNIEHLEILIQYHDVKYYNDEPEISDQDYDGLRAKLKDLAPKSPVLNRVGATVVGDFEKVTHATKMLSLNDVFTEQEIKSWCAKYSGPYVCELKLDGLAIELEYVEGTLYRASTRGNGEVGDDVTHSVRTIKNVPLRLKEDVTITVRGEAVIPKEKFKKLEGFANARNAAAGSVRQKDSRIAAQRHLAFYAYSTPETIAFTHIMSLQKLSELGFEVIGQQKCNNLTEILMAFNDVNLIREKLPIDIDGMVVKINDHSQCSSLGARGRYPYWSIACKFESPSAVTKLIDIVLQKGRTGNITPVAILEPVEIAGSTVTRASLHNNSEIQRKGIFIGAMITVEKAGDIIPEVLNVLDGTGLPGEVLYCMPDECPECGEELNKDHLNWRCMNEDCCIEKKIEYFVSKRCMDIQGLGTKMIEQLVEAELISDTVDVFNFKLESFRKDVALLHGWSDGKINKIVKSLKDREVITPDKFYMSLGIPTIGEMTAQHIAEIYPSPLDLWNEWNEWGNVPGLRVIGSVSYSKFVNWMTNNAYIYEEFMDEVVIKAKVVLAEPKSFLFTGKISRPRSEFEKVVIDHGHKFAKSISKSVDYLVAGEKAGGKLQKAEKLGITVINEDQFWEVIK